MMNLDQTGWIIILLGEWPLFLKCDKETCQIFKPFSFYETAQET